METPADYRIDVLERFDSVDADAWDRLLACQDAPTPFMQHAYLQALQASGSATAETGWLLRLITVWQDTQLIAACPLYVKSHSYGEYVFDWAWARAYDQHGLAYFPKAVVAVPFTPVPGTRLLARDGHARQVLLQAAVDFCRDHRLSSLHVLFSSSADREACADLGLMDRQTVQFHWHNQWQNQPFADFDAFLASLSQEKRKKIRQERRRVQDAGVRFEVRQGSAITSADWDFFYRCYAQTYAEHGNPPYLRRAFFEALQTHQADHWVLFIAHRAGRAIACSLIAVQGLGTKHAVAYGRYWGALERVDCLHFEACYYQPLAWCIQHGVQRFEGGAQGEHKMARALLPTPTHSAHWLAHPQFARAVADFLERERDGVEGYLDHLAERSPFKHTDP